MQQKEIDRINELAHKQKSTGLTEEEKAEALNTLGAETVEEALAAEQETLLEADRQVTLAEEAAAEAGCQVSRRSVAAACL